ncbi:MAG: BatA and WFA domain-containing protein [Pirellulales bacterium]
MSFATPLAFAWLALAIPIVIFYILKIRLRRVPVSTNIFWRQIFDEKQPRSIWQHLRHLISLLVQLALLLLLVGALAEPFFNWEVLEARRIVLVLDNSASMNATDVEPTRLDKAKQLAHNAAGRLRFRDQMAVVVAGTAPQVVCGMTDHERTLNNALEAVQPTDGPTRMTEAIALARRLLGDAENGRVVVVSDGCFEKADVLTAGEDIDLRVVGTRAPNIGLTNFQVRRSLLDPLGYEILVEVTNQSDEPAECRLEVDLNDNPVDVIPLKLEPGQIWSQTLEKTSADGGTLLARIDHDDALAADNTALALLPKREIQKVILITKGNHFLQKVFEANPLVHLTVVAEPPTKLDPGAIVVFHRNMPAKLPPGRVLVVDPETSTDLWTLGDKLANPIVTKQDTDSPLMRHVRLDNVLMPEARQLKLTRPAANLATALSGDPLYAAIEEPNHKTLVLTVNIDQGDLTFRTAFPIMVTNALAWFAGQSGELRESLVTGAAPEVALPSSATNSNAAALVLRTPTGDERPLPVGDDKTTVGPLDQAGIWSIAAAATDEADSPPPLIELACNIASRAESDLRPAESLTAREPPAALAGFTFHRPLWFYLIVLAWLLAALEWYLYQRRWIT